jgi:uncharacterized protein YjdB
MHTRLLSLFLAVLTVFSMVSVLVTTADAASYTWSSLSITSSPSTSKTMKCYLQGTSNQTTYKTSALSTKSGSVYVSDEITVLSIGKNSAGTYYAYIQYPISSGTKKAYIALNKLSSVTSGSFKNKATAVAKISNVYRRAASTTYGSSYISSGDTVYIVTTSGDYTQVAYPITGGWKLAWIKTTDANKYLVTDCTVKDGSTTITSGSTINMNKGATKTVTASVASSASVTWTTSKSSVVKLSSTTSKSPTLTAVGNGTCTVTATVKGTSYSTSFTVKVVTPDVKATSVSLNKTSLSLYTGDTATLTATMKPADATSTVSWSSSNTKVATVNSSGKVTAVGKGTATITAKISDEVNDVCTVTVKEAVNPEKVTLNKSSYTLKGSSASVTLTATVSPSNATNKTVTWSSENTSVAKVSSSGKVTPVSNGTTYITATTANGKSAKCTIKVTGMTKTITVFSQMDSRWKDVSYGYSNKAGTQKTTVGVSGCGILAYVNAVYYLTGKFIEPATLAKWSVDNGYRVNGVGTSHGLYKAYAAKYGNTYGFKYVNSYSTSDVTKVRSHLENGGVAIISVYKHLMALVDYDSSTDKYLVLDSYKSSDRGTYSKGYRWMKASEFTGSMEVSAIITLAAK